jgi:predicted TIM-barrel fold metal-dependent hydrolase
VTNSSRCARSTDVIDAHVHLFPDRLFDAIWRWFDEHAWTIAHKVHADDVVDRLEQTGADRAVGLLYAHQPGMAEALNAWIGAFARRRTMVIPCATVHPRDEDVLGVLRRGRDVHGAKLVKQHCHVLGIAPDDPVMFPLYEACIELGLPLNLHVGNGPKLPGYKAPSDAVSGAARTEAVLLRYPELRLIVPHLGCMEDDVFLSWLDRFPNLLLDTAMAMVPFLEGMNVGDRARLGDHPDRILFGTDFPNIPYPIETELRALRALKLDENALRAITHDTAARVFGP